MAKEPEKQTRVNHDQASVQKRDGERRPTPTPTPKPSPKDRPKGD